MCFTVTCSTNRQSAKDETTINHSGVLERGKDGTGCDVCHYHDCWHGQNKLMRFKFVTYNLFTFWYSVKYIANFIHCVLIFGSWSTGKIKVFEILVKINHNAQKI